MKIYPIKQFNKVLKVPSDKSITHRAIMFNAYAGGRAVIYQPLIADDCVSTMNCMQKLGVQFDTQPDKIIVHGGIKNSEAALDAGNSGTTMRLLSGLLSGIEGIKAEIFGDASLNKRPMGRILKPLRLMNAEINGHEGFAPLSIQGRRLRSMDYTMEVNSAQVKSCLLLAGLNADGKTNITELVRSRDHTEIMLKAMGAEICVQGNTASITPSRLKPIDISVPGDISSAAYFMTLPLILQNSRVLLKNVSLNPTRTGIIDVLLKMGANIRTFHLCAEHELYGDIEIESSCLKPFHIGGELIPRLIDEIPVLAVLACFVEGESVIKDAQELRVKESDRIKVMCDCINAVGGSARETQDGMVIQGGRGLKGGTIDSNGDHRIAMSMAIGALASDEGITIKNAESVSISFPDFYSYIQDTH